MFDQLEMFRLSGALAEHASRRQAVAAANVAQADTPGYRARAVESFADSYAPEGSGPFAMRATRAGHIRDAEAPGAARVIPASSPASPDGNTVSIEMQMAEAARASSDHSRALAIYRSGLTILRAGLGRR